jgi:hypothetical protein
MTMNPIGKLPVAMSLGAIQFREDVHIYHEVKRAMVSWKAAKGLGILSTCYPYPIVMSVTQVTTPSEPALTSDEFPSVFNDTIDMMEGEQFSHHFQ